LAGRGVDLDRRSGRVSRPRGRRADTRLRRVRGRLPTRRGKPGSRAWGTTLGEAAKRQAACLPGSLRGKRLAAGVSCLSQMCISRRRVSKLSKPAN
jgi:hypothetical protein